MATTLAWHAAFTFLFQTTTLATTGRDWSAWLHSHASGKAPGSVRVLRANCSLPLLPCQVALLSGPWVLRVHVGAGVSTAGV